MSFSSFNIYPNLESIFYAHTDELLEKFLFRNSIRFLVIIDSTLTTLPCMFKPTAPLMIPLGPSTPTNKTRPIGFFSRIGI